MKKSKLFLAGILSIALVFGTVLLGCPGDTTEETDTWSAVTSLNQLDGTWKGPYSQTMTIKEAMEETWDDTMQALFGDIKVTTSAEITMTINASAKTRAMSMKTTMTYSGGNIDIVWTMIKTMIGSESSEMPGVTVDDTKHSITIIQDQPAEQISDDDIAEMLAAVQINQNGKKVKVSAYALNGELPEIIMTKQ
jgi:hypothetical protein